MPERTPDATDGVETGHSGCHHGSALIAEDQHLNIVDSLKRLLSRPTPEPSGEGQLVYVYLPESLEPEQRAARYEHPLEAELQLSGLGWVSGGGSLLSSERADGSREILHVGVDVDALDVPRVRDLLRTHLPQLGCPAGTRLQYEELGQDLQDEFDGSLWILAQPQPVANHE